MHWLPVFVHVQPWLFAASFLFVCLATRNEISKRARFVRIEFWLIGMTATVYLIWMRPLQALQNNSQSFVLSVAFLLPLMCLGALHYRDGLDEVRYGCAPSRSISFLRVGAAALFVSVLYPATAYLRFYLTAGHANLSKADALAWAWAAASQVLMFLFVFSVVECVVKLANGFKNPAEKRFLFLTGLCWLGASICVDKVLLASIPFSGPEAVIYAGVFSLAAVSLAGGGILRFRSGQSKMETGNETGSSQKKNLEVLAFAALMAAAALIVPALIGLLDWNSVLEKLWAIALWILAMKFMVFRYPRQRQRTAIWPVAATAIITLLAFRFGFHSEKNWAEMLSSRGADLETALQRQEAFDASFAAASEIMQPVDSLPCNEQCEFIRDNTDIPADASVNLHNLWLVPNLETKQGPKPNIFIIVVDSLRRDYLSAYNSKVTFTPSIGAFARESVVFNNAFTRYGGTTLAEPSIWSGTLQLHKHYVQPFHRVNNLERLIQTDGYQSMVTVDTVLKPLLQPRSGMVQLDKNAGQWTNVDFCSTAAEAGDEILHHLDRNKPIFMFSQPQNIHFVTLGKVASLRPPARDYSPFASLYASELQRLDGCFGNFIQMLKSAGLYDNSIVILTADHGEAMQQFGAERHAFSLKPSVIRIPLIIHVPQNIKASWHYDPAAIAFNTDITASLYELLGQGPVINRPEFGRPLFMRSKNELQKYKRDSYMIASSYGPLYGVLYDNGTREFIENEIPGRPESEEFFNLTEDPEARHNLLSPGERKRSEAQLRVDIGQIAGLFGYKYKAPTLLHWLMR